MPHIAKGWIYGLLVLSIALRLEHRYAHPNLYVDTEVQWTGAVRVLTGEGLRMWRVPEGSCEAEDLPMSIFMPGYALTVAGLAYISGDVLYAGLWLDALVILGLSLLLFQLMVRLLGRATHPGILWWLLFWGWSATPLHPLSSSGLLMLLYLSGSLYFLLQPMSYARTTAALICLTLAAWTRFAAVPLLVWPGLYWMARSIPASDKRKLRHGIMALGMGIGLVGLIIAYKQGQETFIESPARGFFWNQLLALRPFVWESFLFVGGNIETMLQAQGAYLAKAWQLMAWGFSLVWALWIVQHLRKKTTVPPALVWSWALVSGLMISMLGYLSLTWPTEIWADGRTWTFLQEARYYAPAWLLTLILSQTLLWDQIGSRWPRRIWMALVCLNVLAMSVEKGRRWMEASPSEIVIKQALMQEIQARSNRLSSSIGPGAFSATEDTRLPEVAGLISYPAICHTKWLADSNRQGIWLHWETDTARHWPSADWVRALPNGTLYGWEDRRSARGISAPHTIERVN